MKSSCFLWLLPLVPLVAACSKVSDDSPAPAVQPAVFNLENVALIMSSLPLEKAQLQEVHNAVNCSSTDGYDEEYTMRELLCDPGSGVGPTKAKLGEGAVPIRDMLEDYLRRNPPVQTKGGAADVQAWLDELSSSDMQIYWPFSENWDGETFPIVTFDPDFDTDCNYGYEISFTQQCARVVDSVFVDEALARERPVWVINNNSDASYTPLQLIDLSGNTKGGVAPESESLYLKSIQALRNYDSWFAGASEFFIKVGSVKGISAATDDELEKYYPQLTDMMIVVKRSEVGTRKVIDNLLVSCIPEEMDKIAFLMTEDDGGTRTSWKCSATVKVNSKSYGFEMDLPFRTKDDIVWRGQIDVAYFRKSALPSGRFGDVNLVFEMK